MPGITTTNESVETAFRPIKSKSTPESSSFLDHARDSDTFYALIRFILIIQWAQANFSMENELGLLETDPTF